MAAAACRLRAGFRSNLRLVRIDLTPPNEVFDQLCGSVSDVVAVDRTLNGLCDWVEAFAPEPVDLAVEGGGTLKAAQIPVILHYSSADPLK